MKKYILILSVLASVVFTTSCTKDQSWVNRMEGDWDLDLVIRTNMTNLDRDTVTPYQTNYTFNKCKLKKVINCPGSYTDTTGTTPFIYSVTDDGYKLEMEIYRPTDTLNRVFDLIAVGSDNLDIVLITSDSMRYDYNFTKR